MDSTFRTIEKKIVADGWYCVRKSKSSHFQYRKAGRSEMITLVNHGSKGMSLNVIKNLENVTGLSLRR